MTYDRYTAMPNAQRRDQSKRVILASGFVTKKNEARFASPRTPWYIHAQHTQPSDLRVTQLDWSKACLILRLVKTTLQIAKSARILPARKTNQDETAERAERPQFRRCIQKWMSVMLLCRQSWHYFDSIVETSHQIAKEAACLSSLVGCLLQAESSKTIQGEHY